MDLEGFSRYLKNNIKEKNLTIKGTAEKAGISRQNLHKILNGEIAQAKLSTFIKLAIALDEHPEDLFLAYFDNNEFPDSRKKNVDRSGFICDISYQDYSIVKTKQCFTKQWKIKNLGKQIWKDRKLICIDDQLEVTSLTTNDTVVHGLSPERRCIDIPLVKPKRNWIATVNFIAPEFPCTVISHWKMIDAAGNFCFPDNQPLVCLVRVISV